MKSVGLLVLLALSACSAVPDAAWQEPHENPDRPTRVGLYLGQRNLDEDDYEPVDEQVMLGLEFVHEAADSVVGWEFGLAGSADEETVQILGEDVDVEATTGEVYAGIRKSIGSGRFRPYIGGGVAYIQSELEVSTPLGSADVDDGSIAGYLHVGVSFDLTPGFFIGVDLRALLGSDVDYEGFESDADYEQLALTIGGAF
jgi:opacity protein-like surface antigen